MINKRAFSLVELLVTLGIISLVMALLLPAVMNAREAGRKASCANNLRQIGLSIHNYEGIWGSFPPGGSGGLLIMRDGTRLAQNYSLLSSLLPFFEQTHLFNSINFSLDGSTPSNVNAGNTSILTVAVLTFICPSDPRSAMQSGGSTNIRVNAGTCFSCGEANAGPFNFDGLSPPSAIRDGLSQTVAFSEKLIGDTEHTTGIYNNWTSPPTGVTTEEDNWPGICSNQNNMAPVRLGAGRTWLFGGAIFTSFFTNITPNNVIGDCGLEHYSGVGIFSARSYHSGGVNGSFMDGSVRWISSSIQPQIWKGFGTRSGGELY